MNRWQCAWPSSVSEKSSAVKGMDMWSTSFYVSLKEPLIAAISLSRILLGGGYTFPKTWLGLGDSPYNLVHGGRDTYSGSSE